MSYYVHEYSSDEFSTLEACQEDLRECLEVSDIIGYLDLTLEEILQVFFKRKNDIDFCNWLFDKTLEAEEHTLDELITEYEEEEVD